MKYWGCNLNNSGDIAREVGQRMGECTMILRRRHDFWRHGDSTTKMKWTVYNAVVRSKLMYGLESVGLNQSTLRKLDVFQLKGIRKILRWGATFVNRANSTTRYMQNLKG